MKLFRLFLNAIVSSPTPFGLRHRSLPLKTVARKKGSIAYKRLVEKLISLVIKSGRKNVDAFALCELCSKIGYTIQTQEAPDLPQSVTAIAVKLKNRYVILYRPSNSVISIQISVLHELCHILLNHCFLTQKEIGKSFYTASDEASAERLASLLLSRLITQAWWEYILKEQISLSSPPPSIQRFMELASKNSKERNSGSHNAVSLHLRPALERSEVVNSAKGRSRPLLFARIKKLFP